MRALRAGSSKGLHFEAEAHAAEQGLVDAQEEAGHEVLVTDKESAEAVASGFPVTVQQPDFLEGLGAEVLAFIEDEHGPAGVLFLEALVDQGNVVLAAHGRFTSQLPGQDADQPGTAQGAVGVEQGEVGFLVEVLQQRSHKVTFAHPVVAVDEPAVVEAQPVLEGFELGGEGLAAAGALGPLAEGETARAPEALGLFVEGFSIHSSWS